MKYLIIIDDDDDGNEKYDLNLKLFFRNFMKRKSGKCIIIMHAKRMCFFLLEKRGKHLFFRNTE